MTGSAIAVEGVGKRFRRYRERPSSLKERMIRFRTAAEDFWALTDISVDVPAGTTLGLIGPNGSGKTTLLKLIAGILRPTQGTITTRGRIAALLALGAGFHPELTGRENVFLNASILGLSRAETERLFDDIVGFAELEEFIDTQVKFYSSGMYVRLGFAVAVHVDPAILLVDEVLAVGDIAFQRKCLDKVEAFQREGRTIVFVTHAPDLVVRICDRVVLLEKGRIRAEGRPQEVVRDFRLLMTREDLAFGWDQGTKEVEIVSAEIFGAGGEERTWFEPGDDLVIQMDLKANVPVANPVVSFAIHDDQNQFVFGTNSDWRDVRWPTFEGKHRVQFVLKALPLVDGRYFVTLGVHSRDSRTVYHLQEQHYAFDVIRGEENPGTVFIPVECRSERL
ncbi:MAG TPA: ABC transporter ATP-binding protein [Actinomycetota bacterium]|nr:ABC transporter ATP-binding protein [Actinomycetota bacterium]